MEIKPIVSFDDFSKLDLRVGTVTLAEVVPNSEKLLRLEVDLGNEKRQIVAGIKKWYEPEKLVGRQIIIVANLEPRQLAGLESQGMLLAAHGSEGEAILYSFDSKVPNGNVVS